MPYIVLVIAMVRVEEKDGIIYVDGEAKFRIGYGNDLIPMPIGYDCAEFWKKQIDEVWWHAEDLGAYIEDVDCPDFPNLDDMLTWIKEVYRVLRW